MASIDEQVVGADSTAEFAPLVQLKEVETVTGEEDEDVIFSHKARLYRFDASTTEWKERAQGEVKLLQHRENKRVRVLMRQQKILKVQMNHFVAPNIELAPNAGSDRCWTWASIDYSEDPAAVFSFALKVKTPEEAQLFKAAWDKARETNRALVGSAASASSSSSASTTAAASSGSAAAAPAAATEEAKTAADEAAAEEAEDIKAAAGTPWEGAFAANYTGLSADERAAVFASVAGDATEIAGGEGVKLISAFLRASLKALNIEDAVAEEAVGNVSEDATDRALNALGKTEADSITLEQFKTLAVKKIVKL